MSDDKHEIFITCTSCNSKITLEAPVRIVTALVRAADELRADLEETGDFGPLTAPRVAKLAEVLKPFTRAASDPDASEP
jgi:hypothetical protein